MSNSVDPDETAHNEPSYLDLLCLQKPVITAYGRERVKGNVYASNNVSEDTQELPQSRNIVLSFKSQFVSLLVLYCNDIITIIKYV